MTIHQVTKQLHSFFDLPEYFEQIASDFVSYQCLSGYAWRIDQQITQRVANIYKQVREEAKTHLGTELLTELNAVLASIDEAAKAFEYCGLADNGDINVIAALLDLRENAHARAAHVRTFMVNSEGDPLKAHDTPTIEELFYNVNSSVSNTFKARASKSAISRAAKMEPEDKLKAKKLAEKFAARDIAKESTKAQGQAVGRLEMAAGQFAMFEVIQQHTPTSLEQSEHGAMVINRMPIKGFYELHVDVQRVLLEHGLRTLQTAREWSWSESKLAEDDADLREKLIGDAEEVLTAVLHTARFNEGIARTTQRGALAVKRTSLADATKVEPIVLAKNPTANERDAALKRNALPIAVKRQPRALKPTVVTALADIKTLTTTE